MNIRFFWTDAQLRDDNTTLTGKLAAAEHDRDEAQSAYLHNIAVSIDLHDQVAKAKRENERLGAALTTATRDLGLTEKDFLRADAELDRQVIELRRLREELGALTTEVERYRAQASCDATLAAEARSRPGFAVYPPAPSGTAHAQLVENVRTGAVNLGTRRRLPLGTDDRIDIEYDSRFTRSQDTDEPDDLDEVA